ncbi:MAG: hypothetical protein HRT44_03865 [Bdellovibrionales bacterium]|nr:hypothetical protein [Bdellovibrionales bacterium]NQZ18380.1 hypothetical protein [Bdellovibrionales bacterium]
MLKYGVGVAGVLISFRVNYHFYKRFKEQFKVVKHKLKTSENWLAQYAIITLISALIATAISPTLPIYWHLLYIWPMALIPLLLKIDQWLKSPETKGRAQKALIFCAVYFTIVNIFAGLDSKKHDIKSSFHDLYHKVCSETCEKRRL